MLMGGYHHEGNEEGVITMKRRRPPWPANPLGASPPLLYKPLPLLYVRHFLILPSLA
jgi:hypothetical protein